MAEIMPAHICVTCGVAFPSADAPPEHCPISEDEREFINWEGQQWTTVDQMRADGHHNVLRELEPGLTAIQTQPSFAIGQYALLVETPTGNLLWDCLSYIDDATVQAVRERGGLSAIAISHPHFYANNRAWSEAFGDVPVYIH